VKVSLLYHYDSRDVLLGLNANWRWAQAQGLDPLPIFQEIGAISSSEETHLVGGSAQAMILGAVEDGERGRDLTVTAQ